MSQFYNPKRRADWNYGGRKWKLTRSKIDLFIECPRCFYLDNKLGTKRPPGFPFNLNSAVDYLLKQEFDTHRSAATKHPLIEEYGLNAIPFPHKDLDRWRDNFEGVQYKDENTRMVISGAIDDVWQDLDTKELIVVDYKATSKDEKVTLDADWQIGYKRQMEVYQWLLRRNGFEVSDTGYFVYANGIKDKDAFNARLDFEIVLLPYTGNDSWVDDAISKIHACLEDPRIPSAGRDCDYCPYRDTVQELFAARTKAKQPPPQSKLTKTAAKETSRTPNPPDTGTLF